MPRSAALRIALSLADRRIPLKRIRSAPLPDGVTQLLQIANSDEEALRVAQAMTRRSRAALQMAAGLFIREIMMHEDADSYRVLGVSPSAGRKELRHNMALLVKWLHPDGGEFRSIGSEAVRGVLVHRVTQAWDRLKTEERRAAYDRTLCEGRTAQPFSPKPDRRTRMERRRTKRAVSQVPPPETSRRLVVFRLEYGTVWSRIMNYLMLRP